MALNCAKKMKAEALAPLQSLICELVQEFSVPLSYHDRRRCRVPLDRTAAPDDPRPPSHHPTHDHDDRATDHMAQRYRAARPSVEEARTTLLQVTRRHALRIFGMPHSVARARDDRADRLRNDNPARL